MAEVSMVEAKAVTGVNFIPELWMQRRHWALDILREEGVRSLLEVGCGPGALLETLVISPTTMHEDPIRPLRSSADSNSTDLAPPRELFITRLCALDPSPSVIPSALAILTPPLPASPTQTPRWEPMSTELWVGGIEKYNASLEGYEAMVALEVIEHLQPDVLSRFGVVTMGTYRPRLLLVTTPNFDFNAKFARAEESESRMGFMDPTGRTDRVFRHSDHKVEMTSGEFREWAEASAADWGYTVELSGVGISDRPSYYPQSDPITLKRPIYATQTAIFRLTSEPTRSPRSVRISELPFMPGSQESSHTHKLAGRFVHPATVQTGTRKKEAVSDLRSRVRNCMEGWRIGQVSLTELWGVTEVAGACEGSIRYLVGCLGGFGDCQAIPEDGKQSVREGDHEITQCHDEEFKVIAQDGALVVVWTRWAPPRNEAKHDESWGVKEEHMRGGQAGEAGGW